MRKEIVVLFGAGVIGVAIVRRVGVGKHILLADYSEQNLTTQSKILREAGYEVSTIKLIPLLALFG